VYHPATKNAPVTRAELEAAVQVFLVDSIARRIRK